MEPHDIDHHLEAYASSNLEGLRPGELPAALPLVLATPALATLGVATLLTCTQFLCFTSASTPKIGRGVTNSPHGAYPSADELSDRLASLQS